MKNIHVLPTDKPSRIYLIKSNNKLGITSNNPEFTENFASGTQNQHIYITNDEEIKVGDFFYSVRGVIEKAIINYPKGEHFGKLILTTDQNLIKYGVQAIDDEFLEWFVKNPTCEEVEIGRTNQLIDNYADKGGYRWEVKYHIYIQKEVPKREFVNNTLFSNPISFELNNEVLEEPKQETLEEAAEKWFNKDGFYPNPKQGFISGAKWQQERMYSEEDLKEAYFSAIKSTGEGWNGEYADGNNPNIEEKFTEGFEEWFEQFKNK